jgi:protease I
MKYDLHGKRVAIPVAHGFEQSEREESRQALMEAGALTQIVSPEGDEVRGSDGSGLHLSPRPPVR